VNKHVNVNESFTQYELAIKTIVSDNQTKRSQEFVTELLKTVLEHLLSADFFNEHNFTMPTTASLPLKYNHRQPCRTLQHRTARQNQPHSRRRKKHNFDTKYGALRNKVYLDLNEPGNRVVAVFRVELDYEQVRLVQ
jgi:hypothetical protein